MACIFSEAEIYILFEKAINSDSEISTCYKIFSLPGISLYLYMYFAEHCTQIDSTYTDIPAEQYNLEMPIIYFIYVDKGKGEYILDSHCIIYRLRQVELT